MNTRMLVTTRGWFGGGGDLTPMRPETAESQEDAATFHAAFKDACDRHSDGGRGPGDYPAYQEVVRRVLLPAASQRAAGGWRHLLRPSIQRQRGGGFRFHPGCRARLSRRLPGDRAPPHAHAVDGGGPRAPACAPGAVCGVQPAARPRDVVWAEDWRECGGYFDEPAAGCGVALIWGFSPLRTASSRKGCERLRDTLPSTHRPHVRKYPQHGS